MPADGLTKGGIDRLLLHSVSGGRKYAATHLALSRTKVGSATKTSPEGGAAVSAPGIEGHEENLENQDQLP